MTNSSAMPRLLVVEDEYLIRMLLEDMLDDLGYGVAAAVGTLPEARQFATNGDFNAAILDVNLDGQEIYPVADILAARGLPFVFVTGYGERSLPEPYRGRPALQKPFQAEQLKITLAGFSPNSKHLRQLGHERFVGQIEAQWRHCNSVFSQSGEITSGSSARVAAAFKRYPVIGVAAPVMTRIDAQSSWSRFPWTLPTRPRPAPACNPEN